MWAIIIIPVDKIISVVDNNIMRKTNAFDLNVTWRIKYYDALILLLFPIFYLPIRLPKEYLNHLIALQENFTILVDISSMTLSKVMNAER